MPEPIICQKRPLVQNAEPGEYWWCACGRSKEQPFCDGSHKGTGLGPKKVTLAAAGTVAWCLCQHTADGAGGCGGGGVRLFQSGEIATGGKPGFGATNKLPGKVHIGSLRWAGILATHAACSEARNKLAQMAEAVKVWQMVDEQKPVLAGRRGGIGRRARLKIWYS